MKEQGCLEQLEETVQDLEEDVELLQLALLGAQASIDSLTLSCLLRLSDYLKQHIQDTAMLVGTLNSQKETR